MTKVEYLSRARMLEQQIDLHMRRMDRLRARMTDIARGWASQERVASSPNAEAPFVRTLECLEEEGEEMARKVEDLVRVSRETEGVIAAVPVREYQLLLEYRYLEGKTWSQAAAEMSVDPSTAKRWHRRALDMVTLPENEETVEYSCAGW